MSVAIRSMTFRSSASLAVYAVASLTVRSRASALRSRLSAMPRNKAAASSVALRWSVSGRSSPPASTTEAAPMLVVGAIAATPAAATMNVPADAAWAPSGQT
jgi:hypothetical protein